MARRSSIFVFATSERPDPYINVVMRWLTSTNSIDEISFVCVHEHDYQDETEAQALAGRVMVSVQQQLEALSRGAYRGQTGNETAVPHDQAKRYADCIDRLTYVKVTSVGVRWRELPAKIREFRRTGTAAFDVTALKKNLLVDIAALLLSEGEAEIYSFELKRPTYGPADLFAALPPDGFIYRRLTDSSHVETARRRMVARSVTFRTVVSVTVLMVIPVVLVQVFLPTSWLQAVIVGSGAAVSLASWLFTLRQRA